MLRATRALAALSLLLTVGIFGIQVIGNHAKAAEGVEWHEGRLGGSQSWFDARFEVGAGTPSTGVNYFAEGYDSIVVQFDNDRAVDIQMRPSIGYAWTTDEAFQASLDLLPDDVRLVAAAQDTGDGRWKLTCESDRLAKDFTKSDLNRLKHSG